jgi:MFS family permease
MVSRSLADRVGQRTLGLTEMSWLLGLGALCAPLAATQFSNLPKHWRFHYLISLGLACTSLGLIIWVFRFQPEEKLLPEEIVHVTNPVIDVGTAEGERSERSSASALVTDQDSWKKMKDILRSRVVHAMALWAFLYVGLEVCLIVRSSPMNVY